MGCGASVVGFDSDGKLQVKGTTIAMSLLYAKTINVKVLNYNPLVKVRQCLEKIRYHQYRHKKE